MNKFTEISHLEDYQKRFVVRCNAFLTNPELSQGYFREIYDQDIDVELILRMNPATPDICILDDDLFEYWEGVRQLAVNSLREIPIADHLVRLQVYSDLYDLLRQQESYDLVIDLLQAVLAETEKIYRVHYENLHMQNTGSNFRPIFEA